MLPLLLFGIPAAIIAHYKGFASLRWLIALGLIGMITVICLPSTRAVGLLPEEAVARRIRADKAGAWLSGINVTMAAAYIIVTLIAT